MIKKNNEGFTIIEILIVLLIVGVLATIGASLLTSSYRSKSRELSWRMASTIRYLYTTAVTENKTVRLVFDFENDSYLAEATLDQVLLEDKEKADKKVDIKNEVENKKQEEASIEAKKDGEESKEGGEKEKTVSYVEPLEPSFGSLDSPLIEMRSLPAGMFLKDIYTSHDKDPIGSGKAYIYFFPNGYADGAIINFKDEEDVKHTSVKINPFNGSVDISQEYRTLEEAKK